MTVIGDDRFDMTTMLCDDVAEAFLAGGSVPVGFEPVAGLLDELRTLLEGPAPRPSDALAMLLDGQGPAAVTDLATRRTRRAAGLGVTAALVGLVTLGSAGAAAANGRLPMGTQDAVADAIEAVTPFTVPHHRLDDRDVAPAISPTTAVAPAPRTVSVPVGRSSGSHGGTAAGSRATESVAAQHSESVGGRDAAAEPEREPTRRNGSESAGYGATTGGPTTHGSGDSGSGDIGSGPAARGSVDPAGSPVTAGSADLTGVGSTGSDGSGGSGSAASSDGSGSGTGGSSGGSSGPQVIDMNSGSGG